MLGLVGFDAGIWVRLDPFKVRFSGVAYGQAGSCSAELCLLCHIKLSLVHVKLGLIRMD